MRIVESERKVLNQIMLLKAVLFALVAAAFAAPNHDFSAQAAACNDEDCRAPNCRCASTTPPSSIDVDQIPQFVMLTFDDDVQSLNWERYDKIFAQRTNPDGCPVAATFFVSHEYTDYSEVHNLWSRGHEIALHSISHLALTEYWKNLTIDGMIDEFGGERTLIAKFANIPEEAMQGMRMPFLQLDGDKSFLAAKEIGLTYDCSWPTHVYRKPGLWPYTLDYLSIQDCEIGPCPTASIPDVWVIPMIDWTDQQNYVCSMVDACVFIPNTTAELTNWFIDNFNVQYKGNRAPFGFYVHSAYFDVNEIHYDAYVKFVDYLQGLNDVFLVGANQVINWIKNPAAAGSSEWPACPTIEDAGCEVSECELQKGEELRYTNMCGECPAVYPWVGNPLGEAEH